MGIVHTEITLKNAIDVGEVQRGHITEQEVRGVTVQALVDTGSGTLVISEQVRAALGLAVRGLRRTELANGAKQVYQVTEPVEIHWKDRDTTCPALVLPDAREVLLGAIPLEDLDLVVDPIRQVLTGAHGDEVLCMVK
ncbi:retroviral-like aspartic protease family protein [Treponema sp. TIM-1]|uniref:aspartyl protease family protein n=1 Tax=Treponema sp. TIM-1 TaxID=2898417 RepID=UPI003980B789